MLLFPDYDPNIFPYIKSQKGNERIGKTDEFVKESEKVYQEKQNGINFDKLILIQIFNSELGFLLHEQKLVNDIGKGYANGKLCSEKNDNKWIVYEALTDSIGDSKTELKEFSNLLDAMMNMVDRVSYSQEENS